VSVSNQKTCWKKICECCVVDFVLFGFFSEEETTDQRPPAIFSAVIVAGMIHSQCIDCLTSSSQKKSRKFFSGETAETKRSFDNQFCHFNSASEECPKHK